MRASEHLVPKKGLCLSLRAGLQDKQCLCGFHSIQVQLPPLLKAGVPSDNHQFCHRFWKNKMGKSGSVYPQNW